MRHVAVVLHEPVLGGASRALLAVVPLLQERGWTFSFWVPGSGPAWEHLRTRGHPVAGEPRLLRYSWRSLRVTPGPRARLSSSPGYLRRVRAWARQQDADVLHANTVLVLPEALATRGTAPRTVLHIHETLPGGVKGAAAARLARMAADDVVAVSASSVAALGAHRVPARLVYPGIRVPGDLPARGRDADRVVVGTLATVCRRKGSDLFLQAAQRIRSERPDVEFRIVGPLADGPEHDWAASLVRAAEGLGVRCGVANDAFAELAGWDVMVLPSRDDPLPLVNLEAMAMEVPIVATRVGGIPEAVTPDVGILVEPDDPGALAGAILRLVRDPERRRAMGSAGRARVLERFTVEREAEALHRIYLGLVEPKHPPYSAPMPGTAPSAEVPE